jgi:tetratricopeptide (TPR) repeat protein
VQLFRILIVASAIHIFRSKRGEFRRQLNLAQAYRTRNEHKRAQRSLEEAMKSAERTGEAINQADAHLEFARLYKDMGAKQELVQHLAQAEKLIDRAEKERDLEARRKEIQELGTENGA